MDAASDAANAGGATTPPTADMHAERGGVAEPVAGADAPPPRPDDEHVHVDSAVQNDCCDDDGDIDGGVAVAGSGSSGTWRGAASHAGASGGP